MDQANWYALWVKSRHEFVVSQELSRKGINNFLPVVTKVRQWKDRKKAIEYPLFPGYLFVHTVPEAGKFLHVVKTRGTVRFVSLDHKEPTSISPDEIDSLRIMVESGEQIDVFPALKEGTMVRVKRGPLQSTVGILAKREEHHMLIVNIDILGRSVGLKIYAEDVEQA